jgi:hypothetical protein
MVFATGVNLKLFLYEAFRDHQNVISVILPLRQAASRWHKVEGQIIIPGLPVMERWSCGGVHPSLATPE